VVFIYGFGWVSKLFIALASKSMSRSVALEVNEKPYTIHGSRRDLVLKYLEPFHEYAQTRFVYPLIDGFIVISDALGEYIKFYKRSNAILCKVPIMVDFEFYQRKTVPPKCNYPYMIHSATINNHKDGIIDVFKALYEINNKKEVNLFFYLTSKVGLSAIKRQIHEIIKESKIEENIKFIEDLDEETLLAYQAHCSFVIINKVESIQNRFNFATRLGEYLALGIPVITTNVGEVTKYLQDNVSCKFVDSNDTAGLTACAIELLSDAELSRRIGHAGKIIAKDKFDFKVNSKAIYDFFVNVGHYNMS